MSSDLTPPPAPSPATLHEPVPAQPNLLFAILAGLAAALVGAVAWALITVATDMQIGFMAVGVGFLVGYGVGLFNPQHDKVYGYIGAALALLGCLLGNAFTIVGVLSTNHHVSVFAILGQIDFGKIPGVMAETFSPIDLLFYGIALYEGFKFSVKGRTPKKA